MGAACGKSADPDASQPPRKPGNDSSNSAAQEAEKQSKQAAQDPVIASSDAISNKFQSKRVREVYKLGKTLGTGGFSVVKLATNRETQEKFACKVMALPPPGAELDDTSNTREDIIKEIEILCKLEHPNIMWLKEFFDEGNKIYLITEMLSGGELLDALLARGSYTEEDARQVFSRLLSALEYLHKQKIAHRDLKLENLLLVDDKDITNIKLADFGLAKVEAASKSLRTVCGTPQYVAPEVINEDGADHYGVEVDLWSAGIVLFVLLGGYPPFYDESEPRLFAAIQEGKFDFDEDVWNDVSADAKDLIRKLICVDFKKRLTSAEALQHPWVVGKQAEKELTGTRQNMESHLKKKFRAKVKSVIAANRMSILAGAVAAAAASTPATVEEGVEEGDGEDDEDEDKLLRKQGIRVQKMVDT